MSDYAVITDFSAKESLPIGNPKRYVIGAEWDAEFEAIQKALASKVDTEGVTSGSFTPLFTGFSTDPASAEVVYSLNGKQVTLVFNFTTGTSDAAGFTIRNLPQALWPVETQKFILPSCVDNGSDVDGCSVQIAQPISGAAIIYFGKGFSNTGGGGFTSSGSKGLSAAGYSVTYSLNA